MIKIFLQQKPIYKIQQRTFSFLMRKEAGKEDKLNKTLPLKDLDLSSMETKHSLLLKFHQGRKLVHIQKYKPGHFLI